MRKIVTAVVLLSIASVLAACGADTTPTPTSTPTQEPADDHELAEQGEALFRSKGCAVCHGQDAEGASGPPLAGHTREQVFAQVRNPVGDMPAFGTDQVSDEELGKIVAFIETVDTDGLVHHDDHTVDEHHDHAH